MAQLRLNNRELACATMARTELVRAGLPHDNPFVTACLTSTQAVAAAVEAYADLIDPLLVAIGVDPEAHKDA